MDGLDPGGHLRREARPAVHRAIAARAEWDRGRHAACGADRLEAGACGARSGERFAAALRSACLAAITAALRLILKAFLGKKLLFAGREDELIPAVFAGEHLVFQGSEPPHTRLVKVP